MNTGRKRGRKSGGDLRVIAFDPAPRPPVPPGFDAEEAECWRKLTGSQPADRLLPEFLPLLEMMVHHIVAGRRISQMIAEIEASMAREEAEEPGPEPRVRVILTATATLDRLFRMRDRENRAASSLATRYRLTPQTVFDRTKPKGMPSGARVPWEGSPFAQQLEAQRQQQEPDPLLGATRGR